MVKRLMRLLKYDLLNFISHGGKRHLKKDDALAMSALFTTSCVEQEKVIDAQKKEGIRKREKVLVYGAGVTEVYKDSIGADGCESTAPGSVELALRLVGK
jgi:methanogenic corrinoid protein MtbC1